MSEYKKRILLVNEASFLATGFSNYGLEVLRRLQKTGKYEIAELGTYVSPGDPRIATVPWKFYPAQPHPQDKAAWDEYNKAEPQWGRMVNLSQFGNWMLTKVLLDFKPDYVISHMDHWMSTPVQDNPLRKFYRWIYMPCIDSTPLRDEWIKLTEDADYLMNYSEFGINVLNQQSAKIKTAGTRKMLPHPARPGVDMSIFKPMDKAAIRAKWRINSDIPIVLSCMRNQARKLFCEILDSFADYKTKNPNDPIAQKAVYLIHSSGYDAGQEYWLHLLRLSTKPWMPHYCQDLLKSVLHTYMCDACGSKHIDYAIKLLQPRMDNGRVYIECAMCKQWACRTPNTNVGYSREELAEVFNLADAYIQCSIAGADEMPASEAKACGLPLLGSAYAGLEEKVVQIKDKNADDTPFTMHLGGVPIRINHFFTEASTMQTRAYFDRADLTKKLEVLSQPDKLKQLSADALKSAQLNLNYDETAKRWMYAIDNLPMKDRSKTWDKNISENELPITSISIPDGLDDERFVDWCYTDILKTTIDAVGRQTWIRDLGAGRSRKEVIDYFASVANKQKGAEFLLYQHRQQILQTEQTKLMTENPNLLKGILCQ